MPDWIDIAAFDDVEDDDVIQVFSGDLRLAVYKVDEQVYVTDDRCTHQEASLSDGYLDGTTIECPRHQGIFNICTGKVLRTPPEKGLRAYETKVVNDRILIKPPTGL